MVISTEFERRGGGIGGLANESRGISGRGERTTSVGKDVGFLLKKGRLVYEEWILLLLLDTSQVPQNYCRESHQSQSLYLSDLID